MNTSSKTTVNVERRTWDKEAYKARARSRAAAEEESSTDNVSSAAASAIRSGLLDSHPNDEPEEFLPAQQGRAGPLGSARAYLKSRVRKVDLEGKLGSTELIDPSAASTIHSKLTTTPSTVVENPSISSGVTKCKDGVGWHCRVCDCFLKDSLTYLDHINGRKHQRYLGYTMRVEQSTTAEVGNVLKSLAESEKMKQQHHFSGGGLYGGVDYEMVIRNKDEETQRRKADRARRREERKRKENGNNSRSALEVYETRMSVVETIRIAEELEEGREDESGEFYDKQEEEDDDEPANYNPADDDDDYDCEINPMAAMMGFTGFGGSKK